MKRAILVDWDTYNASAATRDFLSAKQGLAHFVLLVVDPATRDFSYDDQPETDHGLTTPPEEPPVPDWAMVIRNTGALSDVIFKERAFGVLTDASDLDIVMGLDSSVAVTDFYHDHGVLVTTDDLENFKD